MSRCAILPRAILVRALPRVHSGRGCRVIWRTPRALMRRGWMGGMLVVMSGRRCMVRGRWWWVCMVWCRRIRTRRRRCPVTTRGRLSMALVVHARGTRSRWRSRCSRSGARACAPASAATRRRGLRRVVAVLSSSWGLLR
jgi:hypothetical protein